MLKFCFKFWKIVQILLNTAERRTFNDGKNDEELILLEN